MLGKAVTVKLVGCSCTDNSMRAVAQLKERNEGILDLNNAIALGRGYWSLCAFDGHCDF